MSSKRMLVTAALPYANGHIHLGHLVEYIQTDIWVRFQKLRGRRCIFICADDTHGTAIMIRARQEGRPETELIADMQAAHEKDFAGFEIAFDHYGANRSGVLSATQNWSAKMTLSNSLTPRWEHSLPIDSSRELALVASRSVNTEITAASAVRPTHLPT